ncbi:MAG TPA: HEPN domain-containing protein [Streptosporangiaceae bacterium]|jgi:HEPN domain-containing protein
MRWGTGEATVERLLAAGHVERVHGASADGASWLDRARRGLEAARVLAESAPDSSVVLACDAARQACVALLAQQGLRPTTAGGHYVVEEVIRAQFGPTLRAFGGLRRRRNELEYPLYPTEQASAAEAAETLRTASEIIDAAAKLVPNLGFF